MKPTDSILPPASSKAAAATSVTPLGGRRESESYQEWSGKMFKLTPSGKLTTLHTFRSAFDPHTDGCLDGKWPFAVVIQGSGGNFYGATENAGVKGRATIFK
jgi:hypothetical protein